MAVFNTKEVLCGSASLIPVIANRIQEEFQNEGYEVAMDVLSSGGYDISITKGGVFKAVLGMKTALKVTLLPQDGSIQFEAGVGIWGQQAIPTIISMFLFWPVVIAQVWGLIQQSRLDDKALDVAKGVVMNNDNCEIVVSAEDCKSCEGCGTQNDGSANFCSGCGKPL